MSDTLFVGHWKLEGTMLAGSEVFRNNIDIFYIPGVVDTPPATTAAIVTEYQNFLLQMFYSDVTLSTLTLRQIFGHVGPPSHLEHPPVWEIAVNLPGIGESTWGGAHDSHYLPADVCVFLKKFTSGGRNGKMFLRNILTESDVDATLAGQWAFDPASTRFTVAKFATAFAATIGPYCSSSPPSGQHGFCVVHLARLSDPLDTRVPYSTVLTSMIPQRPVWNEAFR